MKYILNPLKLAILALVSCSFIHADLSDIKHPEQPMLWKIEHANLETPSYLFGTIHVGDPRITTLHPLAQEAFDSADAFYTEVRLDAQTQAEVQSLAFRNDGKSLADILDKETIEKLDKELKLINPGLSLQLFDNMKIALLASSLALLEDMLKGAVSLDQQLWLKATQLNKELGSLETVKQQMGALDVFDLSEQKIIMKESLDYMAYSRENKIAKYEPLLSAYLKRDLKGLESALHSGKYKGFVFNQKINEKMMNNLLIKRNKVMAESVIKFLTSEEGKTKSHFFAAGSGHFVGDASVNELLKKAGYTISLQSSK